MNLLLTLLTLFGGPQDQTYPLRHCDQCRWTVEVWIGKVKVLGVERIPGGKKRVIVGYREITERKQITVYETQRYRKRVIIGFDQDQRPIWRWRFRTKTVPVTKIVPQTRKVPIYGDAPADKERDVVRWVEMPLARGFYRCPG